MELDQRLDQIYQLLISTYGDQHWWPADTPFEVMVGAILTQNTNWQNVEKAMAGLKAACELTPEGILGLEHPRLQEAIRSSGYFRQKAERLMLFCTYLAEQYAGRPEKMEDVGTEKLRQELLSQKGVGPETADSILLYALGRPVFVIDAYTLRIFSRLGLVPENSPYQSAQALFMKNLDPEAEIFNEYHALIVTHAKHVCRKRDPKCGECVLHDECRYSS
jgi:endonuclease-3 related protein